MKIQDIVVPDLGSFADVPVIEVLVAVGDVVEAETPLVTLETDKASMDVPAPHAGKVSEILISKGSKVSKGSVIVRLAVEAATVVPLPAPAAAPAPAAVAAARSASAAVAVPSAPPAAAAVVAPHIETGPVSGVARHTQVLVLGAGPGGYTAAFRAADLGLQVTLVERWLTLGGVCLNVGCIPSKALLHAAKVLDEAASMAEHGIVFGPPQIDADKLRSWKSGVVRKLTDGLDMLAKQRKVAVLRGAGKFIAPRVLEVTAAEGTMRISFDYCIIAAGSEPVRLPFVPVDPRVMDSTDALELRDLPQRLLVIGGGIIGLEMGCVYDALGVRVSVVEVMKQLMPGADPDLVKPLEKRLRKRYEQILLGVKVKAVAAETAGLRVTFEGEDAPEPQIFDRVLVAVGRKPNGGLLDADKAGVEVDARGFIQVDKQMRSNAPHIFAIGDLVGQPMLAHKATHEGKVAAEVIAGAKRAFDARVIPSVAYTDPEVAWVGLTETEAKAKGITVQKSMFPWAASGRSLAQGRDEGLTKLLFDPDTHRVVGGGLVGPNAGELVGEIALAIEMGADAADVGLTIHPHPTLSESIAFSAEAFEGTLTDLYVPKRK
ncbi:MAG: dihydrolipoyl dehydrogenase [Gammaproteobacteria bacterium]|nr:dihydrolipoyl dehydrogenase [Gammaproteobacteria bacterium]